MPFSEYLQVEGVNWSSLKHMAKSPKHYQFEKVPPPSETRAMVKGRAGHTAILEPSQYPTEYVVFPGSRRAGKEWDSFEAANLDRTILTRAEDGAAMDMAAAVRANQWANDFLTHGLAEQVIEWNDEETGLHCKARLDYLKDGVLTDLKTTADLDPRRFPATAHRLGYHGQLAFYRRGLSALGMDDPETYLVVVESGPPYDTGAFKMDDLALNIGDALVSTLLNRLAECEATKEWPGRYPGVETFYLPRWAYSDDEGANDVGLIIGSNSEAA
jgi:exodeoxyribonuclease VIII